jgi:uncharacterized protein (DUF362 family)
MIRTSTRRELLCRGGRAALAAAAGLVTEHLLGATAPLLCADAPTPSVLGAAPPPVSVVSIKNGDVGAAVAEALELLGGVAALTRGKTRVMLKPNLVAENPRCTTKPEVIAALARLMKRAGKEVLIGEGSAGAAGFNFLASGEVCWSRKPALLDGMQQYVFDRLGYTRLARELSVPLVNLHSGEMVDMPVPGGLAYERLTLHHSLAELDLLCSVPMMKTHSLASVTLGMKNLVGLYPGAVYGTVRSRVHDQAADHGSPGIAYETLDMVRANKLGLVVVDGSTAMEGNGPVDGTLVPMNVIVAGTNPLATDMVAAHIMGFEPYEVPTFTCAWRDGMTPTSLAEIELRGVPLESVRRRLVRPQLHAWNEIRGFWGVKEVRRHAPPVAVPALA